MEKNINLHCTDAYMPEAKLPLHYAMFSICSTSLCLEKFSVKPRKVGRNNMLPSFH